MPHTEEERRSKFACIKWVGSCPLTRRILGNSHHERLRIDGRLRWRFREREKARRTQGHVPMVEDRYVLLEIHYMNICVQGATVGGVVVSSIVLIYVLRCLYVPPLWFMFLNICPKGCPCLTLYISQARLYKSPSRIRIEVFFPYSPSW
jgi:hypothetical protein